MNCPICDAQIVRVCHSSDHFFDSESLSHGNVCCQYFRWTIDGVHYAIEIRGNETAYWIVEGDGRSFSAITNSNNTGTLPQDFKFDPKDPAGVVEKLRVMENFK